MKLKAALLFFVVFSHLVISDCFSQGTILSETKYTPISTLKLSQSILFITKNEKPETLYKPEKKMSTTGVVVGQFFLSELLSNVGATFGVFLAHTISGNDWNKDTGGLTDSYKDFTAEVIGGYIGYAFLGSYGAYYVGEDAGLKGSYWTTFLGSSIGLGLSTIAILASSESDSFALVFAICNLLVCPGSAIILYYTSTSPENNSALLNFSDGNLAVSYPGVCVGYDKYVPERIIQNICLLKISF